MKIAIVNKQTGQVVSSYISNKIEQNTNYFGGPWDDASQFEHVKIPQSLEAEPLANLQAYTGQECVGHQMILDGTELSFDQQGQPILDIYGIQLTVNKYRSVEILEPKRLMRLRNA